MAERNYVPTLRFHGFSSHWNEIALSNVAKVIDCKHRTPPYIDNGIPVVSPGSISWGKLDLISPTRMVSDAEYESLMDHCTPKYGDLVFSRNQSMGVASYVEDNTKFVLGQDTVLIQAERDSFFIYYCLQTKNTQNQIYRLSGGSTFARINLGDIRKLKLFIPNEVKEQQKITEFLGAVDAKLDALRRKRALLAEYKRGVMQKLFSQEIRFRQDDGRPFLDWQKVRLGKLFTERSEKGYDSLELLSVTMNEGVIKRSDIENKDNSSSDKSNYKRVLPGDIAYNSMRMWQGASGLSKYTGIVSPAYTVIVPSDTISAEFFAYFFKYQPVVFLFQRNSQGLTSDTWNLKYSPFSKIKVLVPTSKDEQQKIADFLSAIDNKITAVDQQITHMETFKKGLLQQMFV